MYPTTNIQNAVIMFCVVKRDQPNKARFVTDCCLKNLATYKKKTPLPNIDNLIELVAAYLPESNIVLAGGYFSIQGEESSEKWNTILTTCGKMRSGVMLQEDCNASSPIREAIHDIYKDMVYQCLVIYIDNIIIYSRM